MSGNWRGGVFNYGSLLARVVFVNFPDHLLRDVASFLAEAIKACTEKHLAK